MFGNFLKQKKKKKIEKKKENEKIIKDKIIRVSRHCLDKEKKKVIMSLKE